MGYLRRESCEEEEEEEVQTKDPWPYDWRNEKIAAVESEVKGGRERV